MKKTITINLAGIEFSIDEDAYNKLHAYIESLREHFAAYEDRDEIINDIEHRFAEQFSEKLKNGTQVVTMATVDEALHAMGDVDQMDDEEEASMHRSETQDSQWKGKRLYRDTEHAVIAGVASGIANYLGIDPTIVRIIFLVLVFANGLGVIAYIIFWLAMPEAKTLSDKMAMRGQPMTLNNIEESIKRGWNKAKKVINDEDDDTPAGPSGGGGVTQAVNAAASAATAAASVVEKETGTTAKEPATETAEQPTKKTPKTGSTLSRLVELPFQLLAQLFQGIKKVLMTVLPGISMIIGTFITVISFIAIVVSTFVGVVLLFQIQTDLVDIQIADIVTGTAYYALIIGGYMVALLPALFFFLIGLSFMRRRNFMRLPVFLVIMGTWLVAGMVTAGVSMEYAQEVKERIDETVTQESVERTIDVESFSGIDVSDAYTVHITRADELSVQIEGPEQLLDETRIEVRNGTLQIDRYDEFRICLFTCFSQKATVHIATPQLESINASGATTVRANGFSDEQERLSVDISGASSLEMDSVNVQTITLDQSGATVVALTGTARFINGEISGASTLSANELTTEHVTIELSGASDAAVNASGSIEADVSGASDLRYSGEASVQSDTSGSSTVRRIDGVTEDTPRTTAETDTYTQTALGVRLEVPLSLTPEENGDEVIWRDANGRSQLLLRFRDESEDQSLWFTEEAVESIILGERVGKKYEYEHCDAFLCSRTIAYVVPHQGKFVALEFRPDTNRELHDQELDIKNSFEFFDQLTVEEAAELEAVDESDPVE